MLQLVTASGARPRREANSAAGETELGRNAVVWQPILAAGGLSSPPGGLKGHLQGKIACRTKHAYRRCWAHLNFHDIRSSESRRRHAAQS